MTIEEFEKFIDYLSTHINLISSINAYNGGYYIVFETIDGFYNLNLFDKEIIIIYPNNTEDRLYISTYQYSKFKNQLDTIIKKAKDREYNKLKELIQ